MRTSALASGIVAGLAGGILLGLALTVVVPTHPGLPVVSLMELLDRGLGARRALVGWVAVLAASGVLGAVYGALLRNRRTPERASVVALFFALVLGMLEALVAVPLLVGAAPVLGLANPALWPLAVLAVGINLLSASVMAATFLALRPREGPRDQPAREARTVPRAA
jgi:hypothetical protein